VVTRFAAWKSDGFRGNRKRKRRKWNVAMQQLLLLRVGSYPDCALWQPA